MRCQYCGGLILANVSENGYDPRACINCGRSVTEPQRDNLPNPPRGRVMASEDPTGSYFTRITTFGRIGISASSAAPFGSADAHGAIAV